MSLFLQIFVPHSLFPVLYSLFPVPTYYLTVLYISLLSSALEWKKEGSFGVNNPRRL